MSNYHSQFFFLFSVNVSFFQLFPVVLNTKHDILIFIRSYFFSFSYSVRLTYSSCILTVSDFCITFLSVHVFRIPFLTVFASHISFPIVFVFSVPFLTVFVFCAPYLSVIVLYVSPPSVFRLLFLIRHCLTSTLSPLTLPSCFYSAVVS